MYRYPILFLTFFAIPTSVKGIIEEPNNIELISNSSEIEEIPSVEIPSVDNYSHVSLFHFDGEEKLSKKEREMVEYLKAIFPFYSKTPIFPCKVENGFANCEEEKVDNSTMPRENGNFKTTNENFQMFVRAALAKCRNMSDLLRVFPLPRWKPEWIKPDDDDSKTTHRKITIKNRIGTQSSSFTIGMIFLGVLTTVTGMGLFAVRQAGRHNYAQYV